MNCVSLAPLRGMLKLYDAIYAIMDEKYSFSEKGNRIVSENSNMATFSLNSTPLTPSIPVVNFSLQYLEQS
jgi:hypothetical protein